MILVMTSATPLQAKRPSSRLAGFYKMGASERAAIVANWANLTPAETTTLTDNLTVSQADKMIENVIGRYSLPLGYCGQLSDQRARLFDPYGGGRAIGSGRSELCCETSARWRRLPNRQHRTQS